jgi:hypothetical protein
MIVNELALQQNDILVCNDFVDQNLGLIFDNNCQKVNENFVVVEYQQVNETFVEAYLIQELVKKHK